MTCDLLALTIRAHDPIALARFWGGLLGWELSDDGAALTSEDDTGFGLRFLASAEAKVVQNLMHFDLTSQTPDAQIETVATAVAFGARHIDVGQTGDEGHVVLADPEGNEFCVIEAGNNFLADCGFVGALACDGSQEVGYFWSRVLGWPLVWDQDEETAIRSPHGGPKITWGGPPLMARSGQDRLFFDLAVSSGGEQESEAERLISLGATRSGPAQGVGTPLLLADPDGNEFRLLRAPA